MQRKKVGIGAPLGMHIKGTRIKTIYNTQLFEELKEKAAEGAEKIDLWRVLFYSNNKCIKDSKIPFFWGRLDRVEVKKKGIYFYDKGSRLGNGSFVIRPGKT